MGRKQERAEVVATMAAYVEKWGDFGALEEARVKAVKRLTEIAPAEVVADHCGVSVRTIYRLRGLKLGNSAPSDPLTDRLKKRHIMRREAISELVRHDTLPGVGLPRLDGWLDLLVALGVLHRTHDKALYSLEPIEPKQITLQESIKGVA